MNLGDVCVSIIVPCYNVAGYVYRCLDSLLGQTHQNIEVIPVDDGSTDNTGAIVDQYASVDKRVHPLHQENRGLPEARKAGYLASSSSYVAFVDADDWLDANAIEVLLGKALQGGYDIVSCNVRWEYENNRRRPWNEGPNYSEELPAEDALRALYERKSVFEYVWNKLYRREAIKAEDFPEVGSMGEDYFTSINILSRVHKVLHLGVPLYHYLQQEKSMSQGGFGEGHRYSYERYLADETRICEAHPDFARQIRAYTSVRLLLIILPMARNGKYDSDIIDTVKERYRSSLGNIMSYAGFGSFEKAAVILFAFSPRVFFPLYYRLRYGKRLPHPFSER